MRQLLWTEGVLFCLTLHFVSKKGNWHYKCDSQAYNVHNILTQVAPV